MGRCFYLTLLALLIALASAANAQEWPQKTVQIVVPFPAGGSNDTLCRIAADKLSGEWKQGNGSTSHLSAQMLATQAGLAMVHVPYKGEGPALIDITAGRVDIFVGNISAALKLDDVRTKFLEQGAEPQGEPPQATGAFIKEEEARWRAVITSANVTLEQPHG